MLGIQITPRRLRRVRFANARRTRSWPRNRTKYNYDPVSRLDGLAHDLDGAGSTNDAAFGFAFNPASQIVTRSLSNAAYEFPLTGGIKSYVANGRNQYTQVGGTTHSWDANGNLTGDGLTTFGYDTENRLVSASGAKTGTLSYDPLGRLWEASTSSGVVRFAYDGDRLIAEYSSGGAVLRRYVHGAGVDEPLLWYEGAAVSSATRRHLHADQQGSIVAASNASGTMLQVNAYDAYGITGAGNTGRFQYTGQAAIPELGLLYYKARFYNPALGRFMQTDPIGYEDDVNLYAYVGNDPLNRTDPTGNYGRGSGWDDKQWKRFDKAQQRAADKIERRADKLDKKADKLDAKGKTGGDALRSKAESFRGGVKALRSDGSAETGGFTANAVDQAGYEAAGGSQDGAALTSSDGKTVTVNQDNSSWLSSVQAQWNIGHESLHSAGLRDQRGPNGYKAYKYGPAENQKAFRDLKGTPQADINPDHLMDEVY